MFNLIPRDKLLHIAVGFGVVFALTFLALIALEPVTQLKTLTQQLGTVASAWLINRFIAYAKEAYDEGLPQTHVRDMFDAESTIGGGSLAAAFLTMAILISHG